MKMLRGGSVRVHVVAGERLGPLQVLFSRSLTMANGGTVKSRGLVLKDETPVLRDQRRLSADGL